MKQDLFELKTIVKWSVFVLIIIAILTTGTLWMQGELYPWWLSIQRRSVEQSKSFTDSNNNMLEAYTLEYSRLDTKIVEAKGDIEITSAYQAQQRAIVDKMCRQISTMNKSTVNPSVLTWLNSKGGCQ